MIKEIKLMDVASFKNEVLIYPKKINFFYGSNGTGKTTISKYINNPYSTSYNNCCISLDNNSAENLVYNKDFVDINFNNYSMIKGIFTLGKDSRDIIKQLNSISEEKNSYLTKINGLRNKYEKIESKFELDQKKFSNYCWTNKKDFNDNFSIFFKGFVGKKNDFSKLCLSIKRSENKSFSMQELKEKYNMIFEKNIFPIKKCTIDTNINLNNVEGLELLKEKITGRSGLQISNLIEKIGNSDWVKSGLKFTEHTDGLCPFCQQQIPQKTIEMLNNLFDETYNDMIERIKKAKKMYNSICANLIENLNNEIDFYSSFFDVKTLEFSVKDFTKIIEDNDLLFYKKIESPSLEISLLNTDTVLKRITEEVINLQEKISKHNIIANNLDKEKAQLKEQVFDLLYDKTKNFIVDYNKNKRGFEKGKKNLDSLVNKHRNEILRLTSEETKLRSSMSGISNTIDSMNKVLNSFGFDDFHFELNDKSSYKVVRKNGSPVENTLSEGEQRFISFLYFYQLVYGTLNKNEVKRNRIIVIDDPISSLDSNILFIVSTLVKKIIDDCLNHKNKIEQVFVLTHNVYFLKEVSYRSRKAKPRFSINNTNYFLVTKKNSISDIKELNKLPFTTTYELLWSEIRDSSQQNTKATIFNTMRRILEYYYKIIGGLEYEKLINQFEGNDKYICKSLLSCINDLSHGIPDDYNMILTDELIDNYTKVFKRIFELTNQKSHYDMMMQIKSTND